MSLLLSWALLGRWPAVSESFNSQRCKMLQGFVHICSNLFQGAGMASMLIYASECKSREIAGLVARTQINISLCISDNELAWNPEERIHLHMLKACLFVNATGNIAEWKTCNMDVKNEKCSFNFLLRSKQLPWSSMFQVIAGNVQQGTLPLCPFTFESLAIESIEWRK